jgi:hypothetical protein
VGLFSPKGLSLGSAVRRGVALGDVNGNGSLDAVVPDQDLIAIWLNDGVGQFSDSGQSIGNSPSRAAALADLNGSGHVDLFFTGRVRVKSGSTTAVGSLSTAARY